MTEEVAAVPASDVEEEKVEEQYDQNYFWLDVSTERSVGELDDPPFVMWHATIGFDNEDGKRTTIGRARICLAVGADSGWAGDLDAEHSDLGEVAAALIGSDGAPKEKLFFGPHVPHDVAVIDMVHIRPKWRGQRWSHVLVDHALMAVCPWAVAALNPHPYAKKRDERSIKGLQRHWRRAGFKHFADGVYVREAMRTSAAYKERR